MCYSLYGRREDYVERTVLWSFVHVVSFKEILLRTKGWLQYYYFARPSGVL